MARSGGGTRIEITHMCGEVHVVDLEKRTCTCRKWDLTGIPCGHAVCAIRYDRGMSPEDYLHPCYSKASFLATYEHVINPMSGPDLWHAVQNVEPIQPPFYPKQRGAPKKKRNREEGEPEVINGRLTNKGVKMRCGKCHQDGHNARTCKGQPDPARASKFASHANKAAERRARLKMQRASGNAQATAATSTTNTSNSSLLPQEVVQ